MSDLKHVGRDGETFEIVGANHAEQKHALIQYVTQNPTASIILIDPEKEYKQLCNALCIERLTAISSVM